MNCLSYERISCCQCLSLRHFGWYQNKYFKIPSQDIFIVLPTTAQRSGSYKLEWLSKSSDIHWSLFYLYDEFTREAHFQQKKINELQNWFMSFINFFGKWYTNRLDLKKHPQKPFTYILDGKTEWKWVWKCLTNGKLSCFVFFPFSRREIKT